MLYFLWVVIALGQDGAGDTDVARLADDVEAAAIQIEELIASLKDEDADADADADEDADADADEDADATRPSPDGSPQESLRP